MVWARSVVWTDANGYNTITKIVSQSGASSVVGDLQALSNAGVLQYWESPVTNAGLAPTAARFQSGADRAAMTFLCLDATNYVVIVPAPKATIFDGDQETVDLTNADVIAFAVAAVLAPLCNNAGSPVTVLIAGTRLPRASSPT
jgi:hypothetical protein